MCISGPAGAAAAHVTGGHILVVLAGAVRFCDNCERELPDLEGSCVRPERSFGRSGGL